ncbi:MAG: primosomal protein N' [Planctomycetaceae bacterium]|nr:primosomal protein N' [Planctomycetaceae bacterium]
MTTQQGMFGFAETPEWQQAAQEDVLIADVVFNLPLERPYSYAIPEPLRGRVQAGQRVLAPLGRSNRSVVGYCVGVRASEKGQRALKPISELLDGEPLLDPSMLELTRWIGERYLCGWGQVLDSVIPAGVRRKSGTREINAISLAEGSETEEVLKAPRLTRQQKSVLEILLKEARPLPAAELCERAGCGPGPVNTLRKRGLIVAERVRTEVAAAEQRDVEAQEDLLMNEQQVKALDQILRPIRVSEYETLLLHGVTGSGKTEVYIRAIREVVSYGRQAIVLVPEISLTPQTIRRFRSRFASVAVLHSHMTDAERHWQWQQIASGDIQVVVGARSAVFAPTPHLGLIVIDEEHEPSFKQDSTPRYHAREVARRRCQDEKVPLILGSATPTLESWLRAQRRLDTLVSMPNRVAGRPLPPVVIVDTRSDPRLARGFSLGRAMFTAIGSALKAKGQVILFLNLRGYSPVVWCRSCGTGLKCPNCDISMTWHRDKAAIVCHSCDYSTSPPPQCPSCQSPAIRFLGTGTQKLDEEVQKSFPEARVLRMDSDSMKKPGSHDEALDRFRRGEVDILLGTQMIAKGLDFPNVTLVGVIDADTMLRQPDLRAAERTFQLIAQVAGRTGRGERGGRVLVQTSKPDDPAVKFASKHDFLGFAQHELAERHDALAPPFTAVARVIFRGPDEQRTRQTAIAVAEKLKAARQGELQSLRVLGAAPAPVVRLRNLWRFHLQIVGKTHELVRELWTTVEKTLTLPEDVELAVDVDPMNAR